MLDPFVSLSHARALSASLWTAVASELLSAPSISKNFHRINYIRSIRFRYRSHAMASLRSLPVHSIFSASICTNFGAAFDLLMDFEGGSAGETSCSTTFHFHSFI